MPKKPRKSRSKPPKPNNQVRTSTQNINPLEETTTDSDSSGFVTKSSNLSISDLSLSSSCDTTTDTDCDDDGLSNEAEVYKLGTSAYDIDSDNDYISDKREVEGFLFQWQKVVSRPAQPRQQWRWAGGCARMSRT